MVQVSSARQSAASRLPNPKPRRAQLDAQFHFHGAGLIEDKLIQDKSVESFDRVFGTKTISAFVLSQRLRPESLRFAVFFTSVAGRFGNRGQADYAAANEVVNKLTSVLNHRWPCRVCPAAMPRRRWRGGRLQMLRLQSRRFLCSQALAQPSLYLQLLSRRHPLR